MKNPDKKPHREKSYYYKGNGTVYDSYYERAPDGSPSQYEKNFLNKVNDHEAQLVSDWIKRRCNSTRKDKNGKRVFRLIDYGFGNGRWLPVFEEVAKFTKEKGIAIEVIAYDPNPRGLSEFIKKVTQAQDGYILQKGNDGLGFINQDTLPEGKKSHKVGSWTKDNLTFTIIYGHEKDSIEHQAKVLGSANMAISMFCPLAYITDAVARIATLRMLGNLAGVVIGSVPHKNRFPKEVQIFRFLQKEGHQYAGKIGIGNIVYCRNNENGMRFEQSIHPFTTEELSTEISDAGLELKEMGASKIVDESSLVRSSCISWADRIASEHMPLFLVNYFAQYIYFVAENKFMKEQEVTSKKSSDTKKEKEKTTPKKFITAEQLRRIKERLEKSPLSCRL